MANKNLIQRKPLEKTFTLFASRKCPHSRYIIQNSDLDSVKINYLTHNNQVPEYVEAVPMLIHNSNKKFWVGKDSIKKILRTNDSSSRFFR